MTLHLADLVALDAPAPHTSGTPLLVDLDAIDEDPDQPRREFDEGSLQELADTIRARGVRQPVSVRPSMSPSGRWVLNFGARRLRAARLAGLQQIPVFVDTTADRYDQVIENEQREGLRPLELAMFVQKRLQLGESQSEIARQLGKSRQWVAQATALIDAPDWLLQAYREGRCRGLNELSDLRRLHTDHPELVEPWVMAQASVTRDRIQDLRRSILASVSTPEGVDPSHEETTATSMLEPKAPANAQPAPASPPSADASAVLPVHLSVPTRTKAPDPDLRIRVHVDEQEYFLVVTTAPAEFGHMYVVACAGGPRRAVRVEAIHLRGFMPP